MSHFPRCGTWDSWITDTVNGKDFSTREPHFAGFVLCTSTPGRATAQIVALALSGGRLVLFWESGAPLSLVRRVVTVDDQRWKDGWRVETLAIGDES